MFNLKGCPKCGGDLIRGYDMDEKCQSCLQCGYVIYERKPVAATGR